MNVSGAYTAAIAGSTVGLNGNGVLDSQAAVVAGVDGGYFTEGIHACAAAHPQTPQGSSRLPLRGNQGIAGEHPPHPLAKGSALCTPAQAEVERAGGVYEGLGAGLKPAPKPPYRQHPWGASQASAAPQVLPELWGFRMLRTRHDSKW